MLGKDRRQNWVGESKQPHLEGQVPEAAVSGRSLARKALRVRREDGSAEG
jgi:hypothetical protein